MVAIRNLTERSAANREALAAIEAAPREVANPDLLDQAGLEIAVDRASGKLHVVRKPEDAAGAAGAAGGGGTVV